MPEIGDFLRARRAAIEPDAAGVVSYGQRRVPGLRREELASIAGVSADHYTRIEQGRVHPSDDVLDAIARALELTEPERQHLHQLARPAPRRRPAPLIIPKGVRQILAGFDDLPVYVFGPRTDLLAFNALVEDVVFPFSTLAAGQRNMTRIVFTEPLMRERHLDWEQMAARHVAFLRGDAGRDPGDPQLQALIGELSVESPEFAKLWARHEVSEKTSGHKLLCHPDTGEYELDFTTLRVAEAPHIAMVVFSAAPDSAGARALSVFRALRAPERA